MFYLDQVNVRAAHQSILQIDQLSIDSAAFTAIIGHNGSGKSTLLKLLARQLTPSSGQVSLQGKPLAELGQRALAQQVAYLPQQFPAAAGLTVRELVALGRFPWRGLLGRLGPDDQRAVDEALALTHLHDYASALVDELSGGERQRAWTAMLLAQDAPVLLLDEPTSALDLKHQAELMALLQSINRDAARGVLVVLHDINLALRYAEQVLAISGGGVAWHGAAADLANPTLLESLYGLPMALIDHPTQPYQVAVSC